MNHVDFPQLPSVLDVGPEEHIAAFYEALGWERGTELEPTSITINEQRWLDICGEYNKLESYGAVPGLLWMNIGPSASKDVPYLKVEIDSDSFNRDESKLSPAEKATLDRTIREMFDVEGEGPGSIVHLEPDFAASNDFLLQDAYDAHFAGPEVYSAVLRARIDEHWEHAVDLVRSRVVESSEITTPFEPLFDVAWRYLEENYTLEPPYSHYLDQGVRVNILLGTQRERDSDFTSIHVMGDNLNGPFSLNSSELDNGLTWLVKQQGHTVPELRGALASYDKWGFDAAEITHGTFLASVAEELRRFPNVMGSVTVLTSLSMSQLGQVLDRSDVLTVPKETTVGIFAPWAGGGSGLDIQLERDLDIPSDVRFDIQIEGARNAQRTVQDVYGLVDDAWKDPAAIKFVDTRSLDELMAEAKERAAERGVGHLGQAKERRSPEFDI